jgi:hypothetical protein
MNILTTSYMHFVCYIINETLGNSLLFYLFMCSSLFKILLISCSSKLVFYFILFFTFQHNISS